MAELVTTSTIAKELKVGQKTLVEILKNAGVEPLHSAKHPSGTILYFDREAVVAAHAAWEKAKMNAQAAAAQDDPSPKLTEIQEAIESLTDSVNVYADTTDEREQKLAASLAKLVDQNILLLRAIDGLRTELTARVDALHKVVTQYEEGPAQPLKVIVEHPAKAPVIGTIAPAAKRPLPRILILGLKPEQRTLIEREFSESFDMRFYEADDVTRESVSRSSVERYAKVFAAWSLLTTRVHGIVSTACNKAGQLERVNGGMSLMREKLVDFLATAPKAAA